MGNFFAPEKPRTSMGWPLRQCCGCIPNPAGMIVLGCLSLLSFFQLFGNTSDPNRDAYSENLCENNDEATGPLAVLAGFLIVGIVFSTIFGALTLWLGIIGCQLQNNPNATVTTGCCGRSTGINLGQCAIVIIFISNFLGFIGHIITASGTGGLAKGLCCNILMYDKTEGDLKCFGTELDATLDAVNDMLNGFNGVGPSSPAEVDIARTCEPQTSQAEDNLELCGFKSDGSDFDNTIDILGVTDTVFGSEEQDEMVEDSNQAKGLLIWAIGGMVSILICCPLCTMFVYSATYEVSEAGQNTATGYGGNAAATSVSTV